MADNRKKRARKIHDRLTVAREVLATLDFETIDELLRRAEEPSEPDSMGHGAHGEGGGTAESTATEAAALDGLPGAGDDDETKPATWIKNEAGQLVRVDDWSNHVKADPIAEIVSEIVASITEVVGMCVILNKKRQVVMHTNAKLKERQTSLDQCQRCSRSVLGVEGDYLRSGYCDACRKAWDRSGRPDRLRFEREYVAPPDIVLESMDAAEVVGIMPLPNSNVVNDRKATA